jgi:hypothetical protein
VPVALATIPATSVDFRAVDHLARQIAALTDAGPVLVVLADPRDGTELDRYELHAPMPDVDGEALLRLVLPTDATVCPVGRLHEPSLRRLAHRWHVDHVLVAPCTFGHELVAVAVAPVAGKVTSSVEREVARLTERFAAALVARRLFRV